jgi:hypothetical protein
LVPTTENFVMYKGLVWLIIMGSGFNDWVYWHFFTITINYYSSQSILTDEASLHSASRSTTLSNPLLLGIHCLLYLPQNMIEITASKGSILLFENELLETMYSFPNNDSVFRVFTSCYPVMTRSLLSIVTGTSVYLAVA